MALTKVTGAGVEGVTISSTTDTSDQLILTNTDTGSSSGPDLVLFRQSTSSAADSDGIGRIDYRGLNDANQEINYATTYAKISDASDGTEDGEFYIQQIKGGSYVTTLKIDGNGRVTIPNQPCFYVLTGTASAASSGSTIIGSNATGGTGSNNVGTNIGSHFAVADGKFTAPVAGQYLFFASASANTNTTGPGLLFLKNGSSVSMIAYGYGMTYMSFSHQIVLTLAANDYVQAGFAHYNSASSQLYTSSFGGHLIG